MAHYTPSRPAPFGAITAHRIIGSFETVFQAIVRWNHARKTEDVLSKLSDSQLADIGLDRSALSSFSQSMSVR